MSRGKKTGTVQPVEDRRTRLERELDAAAKAYRRAAGDLVRARAELFDLAGQLNADGVSWRQLEAATGVQAPTLLRGFQTVAGARLEQLGEG